MSRNPQEPQEHPDHGAERTPHLRQTILDPGLVHLLRRMVVALVGGVQAFLAGAHHQRGDLEHGATIATVGSDTCPAEAAASRIRLIRNTF